MLGRRLQELRFEKRLTQEDVAKRINITPGAYGHYESERSAPSNEMLSKLADVFDCSVDYLLGRTKIKKPSSIESYDDLPEDARNEINSFINYTKNKYSKK
jgi:transcriptional regulator with XRE-family HTH domain